MGPAGIWCRHTQIVAQGLRREYHKPHNKLSRGLMRSLETPFASKMRSYEVSREVNRAAVDEPSIIEPVEKSAAKAA